MPVVSMMMPSSFSPFLARSASFFSAAMRSERTLQQMHPFSISTISSSARSFMFASSRSPSMPTSCVRHVREGEGAQVSSSSEH